MAVCPLRMSEAAEVARSMRSPLDRSAALASPSNTLERPRSQKYICSEEASSAADETILK